MSFVQIRLCSKLLKEYFGPVVAEVGNVLMKKGINSLNYVISVSQLPKKKVQEALCILLNHNLVKWEEVRPGIIGYILLMENVLLLIRFPRFIHIMRELHGEEAEMVVDFLCKHGQATASQVITCSTLKLLDAVEGDTSKTGRDGRLSSVCKTFEKLVSDNFIQKSANSTNPAALVKGEPCHEFSGVLRDIKLLAEEVKKKQSDSERSTQLSLNHPDSDIFWKLNYERFTLELRDMEMKKSISIRLDPMSRSYLSSILMVCYRRNDPWMPEFPPVRVSEIIDTLEDSSHIDQYLKIIVENFGGGLQKVGDAGGGEYVLSVASIIHSITVSIIDNIVQERFGSKGLRIFRIIRDQQMIEQDHVVELSMMDKKKSNLLTHRLLMDNFIKLHEVRKGAVPALANKSTYLFHVQLPMLVRMLIDWLYKTICNLMEKREMLINDNKRLLERKARVEMIVENLKQSGGSEDQIKEVEEMFSAPEREFAASVNEAEERLLECETAIDETIFMFQMFLFYHSASIS